jgi:hypothetical protein
LLHQVGDLFEVQKRSSYSNRLVTAARYLECGAAYSAEYFTLRSNETNKLPFKTLLKLGIFDGVSFLKRPVGILVALMLVHNNKHKQLQLL